jgi:hypothetical protein
MSLALYRKYRPSTFSEVIGQEHVTEPLSNALESGKIHHAYLFSGVFEPLSYIFNYNNVISAPFSCQFRHERLP